VLVTVLTIEPEATPSLAEIAPQLRADIARERAATQVRGLHDKIEDARAGGSTIEEAAAKLKLPVTTYEVDRSGRDPSGKPIGNVPHVADIVKAAFASDVGVDNDPLDAEGGYIWYDVAAITPARPRTLDEVKAEVEQRWRNDEIGSRLKSKADELVDKLKNGETLPGAASAIGVKVATAKDLKRGLTSGSISASMTDAIFRTAKDAYGSAASDDALQWIVFRVTDVKTPALDAKSADSERLTQTVRQGLAADLTGQYVARLEDDLGTSINAAALSQATGNSAPDRE